MHRSVLASVLLRVDHPSSVSATVGGEVLKVEAPSPASQPALASASESPLTLPIHSPLPLRVSDSMRLDRRGIAILEKIFVPDLIAHHQDSLIPHSANGIHIVLLHG